MIVDVLTLVDKLRICSRAESSFSAGIRIDIDPANVRVWSDATTHPPLEVAIVPIEFRALGISCTSISISAERTITLSTFIGLPEVLPDCEIELTLAVSASDLYDRSFSVGSSTTSSILGSGAPISGSIAIS